MMDLQSPTRIQSEDYIGIQDYMRVPNQNRDYSDTSGIGGLKHALISPMEQFSLNNLRESPS